MEMPHFLAWPRPPFLFTRGRPFLEVCTTQAATGGVILVRSCELWVLKVKSYSQGQIVCTAELKNPVAECHIWELSSVRNSWLRKHIVVMDIVWDLHVHIAFWSAPATQSPRLPWFLLPGPTMAGPKVARQGMQDCKMMQLELDATEVVLKPQCHSWCALNEISVWVTHCFGTMQWRFKRYLRVLKQRHAKAIDQDGSSNGCSLNSQENYR